MPTIKDLQAEIESLQAQAQEEHDEAQQEQERAEQAQGENNEGEMQSHLVATRKHEQNALGYEQQAATAATLMAQQQREVEKLQERRALAEQTFTSEIARYDAEISQLTGE
jgi:hypothetical protein